MLVIKKQIPVYINGYRTLKFRLKSSLKRTDESYVTTKGVFMNVFKGWHTDITSAYGYPCACDKNVKKLTLSKDEKRVYVSFHDGSPKHTWAWNEATQKHERVLDKAVKVEAPV